MDSITVGVKREFKPDILVCGLGPAGVSAAVSAARSGADVMAVDKCAYSGGNITASNVIGVCGGVNYATGRLIVGGVTEELLKASAILRDPVDYDKRTPLRELDLRNTVLQEPFHPEQALTQPNAVSMLYDAEWYKLEADRLLLDAGVKILYHTFICDVKTRNGHIESVVIANKDGIEIVRPKLVIDCTGDGDVAEWSGAPFEILPDIMQAGTLMFVVGGVEYNDYGEIQKKCIDAFRQAEIDGVPCRFGYPAIGRLQHGIINFNMTHVKYNQTVAEEFSAAEIRARQDIDDCIGVLKAYVPEFRNSYLLYSGPNIGARESRRILGEYVLTAADVIARKSFPDTIALGGHMLDIHDPAQSGVVSGEVSAEQMLQPYQIPYRTLVPKKVDNLLVAGRCHSVDHIAAGSTRVAMTAGAMGEAAGYAANLALHANCSPAEVNTEAIRSCILQNHGILEPN